MLATLAEETIQNHWKVVVRVVLFQSNLSLQHRSTCPRDGVEDINKLFAAEDDVYDVAAEPSLDAHGILVIRLVRDGQIVWAAPPHIVYLNSPGQLLLMVKLAATLVLRCAECS